MTTVRRYFDLHGRAGVLLGLDDILRIFPGVSVTASRSLGSIAWPRWMVGIVEHAGWTIIGDGLYICH